jgi:hypothetical protein
VKYDQCVKICSFDVLVLFLNCVQFLKHCVQFLMNTILNLAIIQFLMKNKGRRSITTRVSHLRKREMRGTYARLASEAKGDAHYGGASPFYLTAQKLHEITLCVTHVGTLGHMRRMCACVPIGTCVQRKNSTR